MITGRTALRRAMSSLIAALTSAARASLSPVWNQTSIAAASVASVSSAAHERRAFRICLLFLSAGSSWIAFAYATTAPRASLRFAAASCTCCSRWNTGPIRAEPTSSVTQASAAPEMQV